MDFRRMSTQHAPVSINGTAVEWISSTRFLGVHISRDLSWCTNTALATKIQQSMYFLWKLRRAKAPSRIIRIFDIGNIMRILTSCIAVYVACTVSCRKTAHAAERINGVSLPSFLDIYNTYLTCKATRIVGDLTHPPTAFSA